MDKRGVFFFFLFITNCYWSSAQDSIRNKKPIHFGINIFYTNSTVDSYDPHYMDAFKTIDPEIEIRCDIHSLSIGPKLFLDEKSSYYEKETKAGARLSYKYLFKTPENLFNHFCFVDFTYARFKYVKTTYPNPNWWYQYTQTKTLIYHNVNSEIGYGIQYKIFKVLFLNASLGLGVHLFNKDYFLEVPDNPIDNKDEYGNDLFGYGRSFGFLKLGFGYELK